MTDLMMRLFIFFFSVIRFRQELAEFGETKEGFKLERLAVLKEFRGKGIGAELMEHMMNEVLPTDKKIYLNSQADVIDVYKKFGFRTVGSIFYEAGIEHYKMVYTP
jgi:predicted GNAT family N-acyltransferase